MERDRIPANERDFKGAYIPKDVWCNPELTDDEKLMWGEIFSLDNDFGCVASNEHFMEMFSFNNMRRQYNHPFVSNTPESDRWFWWAKRCQYLAFAVAIFALVFYVVDMFQVRDAINHLNDEVPTVGVQKE